MWKSYIVHTVKIFLTQDIFGPRYFRPKIFLAQDIFGPRYFWPKIFLAQDILGQDILGKRYFRSKIFWVNGISQDILGQDILGQDIFSRHRAVEKKYDFGSYFPTSHIDVCIEQTSIWLVSGSHCSTAQLLILMVPTSSCLMSPNSYTF